MNKPLIHQTCTYINYHRQFTHYPETLNQKAITK